MKNMLMVLCLLTLSALTPAKAQVSFESITSYYCLQNTTAPDGSVVNTEKVHFFHNERFDPSPLPWGQNQFDGFCHNKFLLGDIDNALYPRLGTRPSSFLLFSFGNTSGHSFKLLSLKDSPLTVSAQLGYVLDPKVAGHKVTCPAVGIPTEKLYAAISVNPGTGEDTLLLPQSEINRVWFFVKNGVLTAPSSDLDRSRTLYFYWPLNFTTPFVKQHDQKLFRVVYAHEAGINYASISTPDRSLGCIPKQTVYAPAEGLSVGESCSFDVDCASLNCSVTTNTCAVSSVLKPAGQACLATNRCERFNVTVSSTVVTGRDPQGRVTCRVRGSYEQVHASCLLDACVPPEAYRSESDPRCSSR